MGKIGVIAVIAVALAISMQGVEGLECSDCTYLEHNGKIQEGEESCKTTGINVISCSDSSALRMASEVNSSMTVTDEKGPRSRASGTVTPGERHQSCLTLIADGSDDNGGHFKKVFRKCLAISGVKVGDFCDEKTWQELNRPGATQIDSIWTSLMVQFMNQLAITPPHVNSQSKIRSCNCASDKCNVDGGASGGGSGGATLIYSLPAIFTCLVLAFL